MAKKPPNNVIPFPTSLTRLPHKDATYGRIIDVQKWSFEIFAAGNDGMVLIDACVPKAIAARMLACIER